MRNHNLQLEKLLILVQLSKKNHNIKLGNPNERGLDKQGCTVHTEVKN